jgi:hypothetical protein
MAEDTPPSSGGKTVDVPVIGRTPRKYVFGAAAVVAVIVGYAYWRRAAGAAEAATPDYYADLRTGSDTGSDAYTGASDSISGSSGTAAYDSTPRAITTDQEWVAAVEAQLTYLEPGYLATTLGKYLARQPLTSDEADVIRAAWAARNKPPSNPPIILASSSSTPGTTSTIPGKVTGLVVFPTSTATETHLRWTAVSGATGYRVIRGDGAQTLTTTDTKITITGLKPATVYDYSVEAFNSAGTGPRSATVHPHTARGPSAPGTKPAPKPSTGKPASKPQVSRTLRRGSTGEDVKIVQRIVGASADGRFGPATEQAVKAWQRAHGLAADGIVGPNTQAKMGI